MTTREAVVIIAEALLPVCSDGNSDALGVAADVLDALKRDDYLVVKVNRLLAPPFQFDAEENDDG